MTDLAPLRPEVLEQTNQDSTRLDFLEFQVNHLEAQETPDGEWTIKGLAIPYGEELERLDWWTGATRQVFNQGAAVFRDNAALFYGHDHLDRGLPIGRILEAEDTEDGPRITAKVSRTAKGGEVYTLLQDGVLDRFSVGYYHVKNHLEDVDSEAGALLVHDEIDVFETSVVPDPAFQSAKVETVLHRQAAAPRNPTTKEGPTMTETATVTPEDIQGLARSIDTLERQVATLGQADDTTGGAPEAFLSFDSYGEFLSAAASGTPEAMAVLEYVGGVVGDLGDWVKDTWVGDLYRPLEERRRLLNLFESSPLPASGMNVEYGKLLEDTTQVDVQAAEGDLLPYGRIKFTTDTAPLVTYGGWGEMSRQEVERSAIAVVEKFFQALLRRYAQRTEAAVRAAAIDAANATALVGTAPDLDTVEGWTDFVVDASFYLDDQGHAPEFILAGRDVFKGLAKMRLGVDGPFFLDRASGSVNVTGLSGQVFNVPVVPVNQDGLVRVGDSSAIRTFEAGGAPFRLQDDDITHLTKAFSVYGYMAIAVQDKTALVAPATGV